jgi:CubicO group peptidase (beta-lactamase class C family)
MRSILWLILLPVLAFCAFVVLFVGDLGITTLVYGPEYVMRLVQNGDSRVDDYLRFPERPVANQAPAFRFPVASEAEKLKFAQAFASLMPHRNGGAAPAGSADKFLADTDTTGFIAIHDGQIVHEGYFNGYRRDSIQTSFSMAKSITSMLIGAALADGSIVSADTRASSILPDVPALQQSPITIRDLLLMASGLHYDRWRPLWVFSAPWDDDSLTYYDPMLRALAKSVWVEAPAHSRFLYNNYHPLLLGMILERTTHMTVAAYLEKKLWSQIGTEFPASWSLDSKSDGFEKMESGLNARTVDFAKLGLLMLNRGTWNGHQVLPEAWVNESTSPSGPVAAGYYAWGDPGFFAIKGAYYKYLWWGLERPDGSYDYFADGKFGQYIYISPSNHVVIVRNGKGGVDSWPLLFRDLADALSRAQK